MNYEDAPAAAAAAAAADAVPIEQLTVTVICHSTWTRTDDHFVIYQTSRTATSRLCVMVIGLRPSFSCVATKTKPF